MLRWRLIIEEYGTYIQYIPRAKNILTDAMSRFLSDRQPKSTHESNYFAEMFLEMYDIKEIQNVKLPLKFTTIDHHQWEDIGIQAKLISAK